MQKLNKARFLIYERPVNKEKGKIFSSFSLFFVECDLPLCQDESPFLCRPMTSEIVTAEMASDTSTDVTTTEDNVTNPMPSPVSGHENSNYVIAICIATAFTILIIILCLFCWVRRGKRPTSFVNIEMKELKEDGTDDELN